MPRNELEIVLRLRDEATRALKRAQGALKGLEGGLKRAKVAAARLNAELERAAPASRALMAAVAGATAAVGGLGVKAIATAGQFEQMRIAFTTMLGDAEKADRFLRELYDFAARTPFEIEGLQRQVQLLLALGFRAEEVIPTLRAVGDAVAALGGSSALLDRVVLALGQIRAKGKVSAEEMRQLAEAGIPAWEMLAKKIGVDIPTAMKLAEKGAIDAATGVSAILEGMQARFSGMMERQSQTLLGIWSNIKDNLTRTLAALGEDLDRTFHVREGMKAFLAWLDRVRAWFEGGGIRRFLKEHARSILELAGAITGALVPALIQAIRGLALFAARLAPWAAAGYAAVKILEALGVSLADLKRWAALGAQAIAGLGKIFQAVVADAAGVVAFWRSALGGILDAFERALFFLDRAWKAIQEKNIEGARFALQTATRALTGSLGHALDAAAQESADFFARANKLAEDGLTQLFMTVQGTLGETAQAAQKAFDEIAGEAEKLGKTVAALAGGANAPIPQLNTGLGQTAGKADQAKEKILSLNEAIQRQLELFGQAAPRATEYAKAFLGVVSPREEAPTAGGGQTPTWLFRMPGYRRRHGGLGAEMRARAEAARSALEAASKLTATERDRRRALAEIRAEQERLNELARQHLELQRSLLRAREQEIARMKRILEEASKLTQAELDRRRAAREIAGMPSSFQETYEMYAQYGQLRRRSRQARAAYEERRFREIYDMYAQYQQSRLAARQAPGGKEADVLGGFLSGITKALGALNPFAAILQKINPLAEILAAMLEKLQPVLEPITEVLVEIGGILADLLAPALKAITPIIRFFGRVIRAVAEVVAGIWNAIARAINAILGWLGVHLELIKFETEKVKEERRKRDAASKAPTMAPAIRYELPTAPVLAAPSWVDEMGRHVARFGEAVNRFASTVSAGDLAYSVRGLA